MVVKLFTIKKKIIIKKQSCEVRRRRWNWLGHILRREGENDCFTALGWTPKGRRARGRPKTLFFFGRPKTTWRRTVEKERNKAGWRSWEVVKAVAQGRKCWSLREHGGLLRLLAR